MEQRAEKFAKEQPVDIAPDSNAGDKKNNKQNAQSQIHQVNKKAGKSFSEAIYNTGQGGVHI